MLFHKSRSLITIDILTSTFHDRMVVKEIVDNHSKKVRV